MIKLNKTTHLMILFTFAVVFVVIYLYYTINDVKRMNREVTKLTSDVAKINVDVQNIIGTLSNFNKEFIDIRNNTTNGLLVQKVQQVPAKQSTAAVVEEDDDATSVDTAELKRIINDDDVDADTDLDSAHDDAENVDMISSSEEVGAVDVEPVEEETIALLDEIISPPTTDDIKKMNYEQLKTECKSRGISQKGSKEQLIAKLIS